MAAAFFFPLTAAADAWEEDAEDGADSERVVSADEIWGAEDVLENLKRLQIVAGGNLRMEGSYAGLDELDVAGGKLTLSDSASLSGSAIRIAGNGSVRLQGFSGIAEVDHLTIQKGMLELRESSVISGAVLEDGSIGGVLELGTEGGLLLEGASYIDIGRVRSEGGTIEIRATPWVTMEEDPESGEMMPTTYPGGDLRAGVFHAAKGATRVVLGGGDLPEDPDASVFGSAKLSVSELLVEREASLNIELMRGGRFVVGSSLWEHGTNAEMLPGSQHPDAGALVIGDRFVLSENLSIKVGEGLENGIRQNLRVARSGVIELDGPNARLVGGVGTWTHFDLGAILWIFPEALPELPEEVPDEPSEEGESVASLEDDGLESPAQSSLAIQNLDVIESLDFSEGKVTGLENLTVYVGTEGETGDLFYGADGKLHILLNTPEYQGRLANLTKAVWLKRKDIFTPQYFRKLFLYTEPQNTAANLVRVAGSTAAIGTRERMTADMTELSGNLAEAVRTLDLRGRVPVPAPRDALMRKVPEVLTSIPVLIDASAGQSRTSVPIPELGLTQTVKSDDTTVRGALVLGHGELRFGLYGAFTESDFKKQDEDTELPLSGSSERAVVSLFAEVPKDEHRFILDLTWSEAADQAKVPSAGEFLHAEGVKRSLWSFGAMSQYALFTNLSHKQFDWTATGLAGLRVWKWDDAEALWQAESGDILKTRESGSHAVSATLGVRFEGGINFANRGLFAEWLPRRIDGSLTAAIHGLQTNSSSMTVRVPGIEDASGTLPVADLPGFRMSADAKAGIQFPQTRVEVTGSVMKAGSRLSAYSVGARLSWLFNEI